MSFKLPKQWEKESDDLYVHTSLIRIQRMTFRQKTGWFLIPTDIKEEVVGFEATDEGRDKAFEHFEANMAKVKAKSTKTSKAGKKKASPKKK